MTAHKKITITGATGFIGTRLVKRLMDAGHSVHVLGRSRRPELSSLAAFSPWDAMTSDAPDHALNASEVVIHLAGEPVGQRWNEEVKRRIRDSRVIGTRNLVRGIAKVQHRPRVLVSASAVGY